MDCGRTCQWSINQLFRLHRESRNAPWEHMYHTHEVNHVCDHTPTAMNSGGTNWSLWPHCAVMCSTKANRTLVQQRCSFSSSLCEAWLIFFSCLYVTISTVPWLLRGGKNKLLIFLPNLCNARLCNLAQEQNKHLPHAPWLHLETNSWLQVSGPLMLWSDHYNRPRKIGFSRNGTALIWD